jgi:hypothetical protein
VQQYGDPLSFFSVGGHTSTYDPKTNDFIVNITAYYGANGLSDSAAFKPNFTLIISKDSYAYHFKRRFFEPSSPLFQTKDQTKALEMLVGWAQSYASAFVPIYQGLGGNTEIDHEEFISVVLRLAIQQKTLGREQKQIKASNPDDADSSIDIVLEPYPLTAEEIETKAENTSFEKASELRLWGREIEHLISRSVQSIKSLVITKDTKANKQLKDKVSDIKSFMAQFQSNGEKSGLLSLFRRKSVPIYNEKPDEFLFETLEKFGDLLDAIFKDQSRCLKMAGNVESFVEPFKDYGDILQFYSVFLHQARKTRAAKKTRLDGIADNADNQILTHMAERRDELKITLDVHKVVSLGLENFLICKNSQYDALELLKRKIETDIQSLFQVASVKLETLSRQDQNKVVIETIAQATEILDELESVIEAGNKYDIALLNDRADEIIPLKLGKKHTENAPTAILMLPPPSND